MNIGIVGLGLMGGSFAKAYKTVPENKVFAYDCDSSMLGIASIAGDIDGILDEKNIPTCDLIILCLYPADTIDYAKKYAHLFNKSTLIMDCCGTKKQVCTALFELSKEYGFTYIGGHPMAGTHFSGYKYSKATMFHNAPMVLVPPVFDDIELIARAQKALEPMGFGRFTITTMENHDRMIAFTSQLAHIVSNAYIKSPTAEERKGFSGGSYKDLTRVAWLNENMWSQLFVENKEPLLFELNTLIDNLTEYRDALEADDKDELRQLLLDGKLKKEQDNKR